MGEVFTPCSLSNSPHRDVNNLWVNGITHGNTESADVALATQVTVATGSFTHSPFLVTDQTTTFSLWAGGAFFQAAWGGCRRIF